MLSFSPSDRVAGVLAFEAALARALVAADVISPSAAAVIGTCCDVARFDLASIERDAIVAGNVAIPIVEQLRALVGRDDIDAATYVHWGATSQDALDTALVLQLRDVLASMGENLSHTITPLADLATTHAETPMIGRTLMQHAVPTTFGFKAATWLDPLLRLRERLAEVRRNVSVLQFGGAVGNLAALGADGPRVAELLAKDLGLSRPRIAWHASRDRVTDVATTLALLTGSLGKIARDVSLLSQSEIDEVREGAAPGRGRSSTMPHKRNPVACAAMLAAAIRAPHLAATMLSAMPNEHERALGGWQAEWDTLPELCRTAQTALMHAADLLANLEVRVDRMEKNLDATGGLVFAEAVSFELSRRAGRDRSKAIIDRALQQAAHGAHLKDALCGDAEARQLLSAGDIDALFDVRQHLGVSVEVANAIAARARQSTPVNQAPT